MSCLESLLSKIIHLPKSPLERRIYSRSLIECQFLYFLALSKHITQTCWYKHERNNCMWWLSTFSLLVTEKCEKNSQSSSMWWAPRVWGGPGFLSSRGQGTRETFRSSWPAQLCPSSAGCSRVGPDKQRMGSAFHSRSLPPNRAHLSQHQSYFPLYVLSKCHPSGRSHEFMLELISLRFQTDFTRVARPYLGQLYNGKATGISTSGTLPNQFLILSYFISSHLTGEHLMHFSWYFQH